MPAAPRRLLVLNPNRQLTMTQRVLAALQPHLATGWQASGITCDDGPEVIATPETFDAGTAATLRAWQRLTREPEADGAAASAVLLACFGDPGLEALRARCPLPVIGLAEATLRAAAAQHRRYAVITCGPAWVPMLRQRARDFGCAAGLTDVIALPVNGAQLMAEPARWMPLLQTAVDDAMAGGAQALVLGGAAFAGLPLALAAPVPFIDSFAAAGAALPAATPT